MTPLRIHIKSYGCSTNLADGEVLAGCLSEAGYELTDSTEEADVVVVNCCSVKGPTENRMIDLIKRVPQDKKVVVAGCLPLTSFGRLQRDSRFDGVVGPAAGAGIVDVVERVLAGEKVVALDNALRAKPSFGLPRLPRNRVVSLVPVSYGCLGACAYCCVVFARGRLRSHGLEEIVDRIKCDLSLGVKEFWLTSQDMGCYGRDFGMNLAALLRAVSSVPWDFRVRVGMMTPNFVLDMLPELVGAFDDAKVFKFLHLPVQSGDDGVLQGMKRCYTVKDFEAIVDAFRARFPNVTLATDVIVGFPGESKQAFERTLDLIRRVKPDIVNVSKFFARPGTAAASMMEGVVAAAEIKRRSASAARLVRQLSLERNQRWVDWSGEILVDEKGKRDGWWVGRNFAYKPVVVKSRENLFGRVLKAKTVNAFNTHLEATVV